MVFYMTQIRPFPSPAMYSDVIFLLVFVKFRTYLAKSILIESYISNQILPLILEKWLPAGGPGELEEEVWSS